ncbi:MAG: YeeE/YedE family protein [Planctomycetes bacterium]|nr:YeeE/YedE family protein [Planctomycetota bacterium]
MGKPLIGFLCGLLFAFGLGLAQMTEPSRVIGFLDFFGHWDPTLMFVMGGAIAFYMPVWYVLRGRKAPIGGKIIPKKLAGHVDTRLIAGASIFGIGWGTAGVCPGPGIVLLGRGNVDFIVFVGCMIAGMLLYALVGKPKASPQVRAAAQS